MRRYNADLIPFTEEDGSAYFKMRSKPNRKVEVLAEDEETYLLSILNIPHRVSKREVFIYYFGAETLN